MAAIFFDTNWENALAKKHPKIGKANHGRFSFRSALGPELITSWYPGGQALEKFDVSGNNINVVDNGYNTRWYYSNILGLANGEKAIITVNVTRNSNGFSPVLRINDINYRIYKEILLNPGINTIDIEKYDYVIDRIYIRNGNDAETWPMNFSATINANKVVADPTDVSLPTGPAYLQTDLSNVAQPVYEPSMRILPTEPVVVSAATILAQDAEVSNIVTEDGTIIGNSANSPIPAPAPEIAKASMLPETLFGLPKKTYLLYGVAAIAGLIIIRKLFK